MCFCNNCGWITIQIETNKEPHRTICHISTLLFNPAATITDAIMVEKYQAE
jgi:pentose-5-phosphate-3-epimerase